MDELEQIRKTINEADKQMAQLFCERMQAVGKVAEHKQRHGLPILDENRERAVIEKNAAYIADVEMQEYYVNFIKNVMAVSRAYQAKKISGIKIAYSGTEGAFAYLAAKKLYANANYVPFGSFESAYKAVEDGECDLAILPVENSSNGEVGQVMDLLFNGSLYVNNAVDLAVTQDLLGLPQATAEDIVRVVSHPQALGQCEVYLKEKGLQTMEYANTALAAKYVAEKGDVTLGAIASAEAAEIFGLKVLARNVNHSLGNTTRFVVCSRSEKPWSEGEKDVRSILIFSVRNEAGSLAKAIDIIGGHGYNMLTLCSRPMKGKSWQYYFFVEIEGNVHTDNGRKMAKELQSYCDKVRIVGAYKEVG